MALIKETEFKGNPMLAMARNEEDRYPFQFGLRKAKLILEHFEDIKQFVDKYDLPEEEPVEEPKAAKKSKK